MFRKVRNKLLAGLTALACVFGVVGAWSQAGLAMPQTAQAETVGEESVASPMIEIASKNLSYSDSLYILYAVSFDGFDESQNEVKMLFWDSLQTEYSVETAMSVKSAEYTTTVGEQTCIVFYSDGIAAKEMNDTVYCRAYAVVDGVTVYSDVEKYSVVDYVYEKKAEGNLTANQTAVFADMLDYGSSAQKLFGYNTDKLANATYYTVTVENGTLEDGFAWGRYAMNETVTLTANAPADGYRFLSWGDELGASVGETETLSVAVIEDKTYTATYAEISEGPETEETPASAFEYTSDGASVTITKYVGDYTDVIIPSTIDGLPVTKIGYAAFQNCRSITTVMLPDSVQSLSDYSFAGCRSLTSIELPEGISTVSYQAFADCVALTKVLLPDTVTDIDNMAFYNCKVLSEIQLPMFLETIGERSFESCNSLAEVVIPNGVTSIGQGAFQYCDGLRSVTIPVSVTRIGYWAFEGCAEATFCCEAESKPYGWDTEWNPNDCPVVWGYVAEEGGETEPEEPTAPATLATFTFGENGDAAHVDGGDLGATASYTENGYTLDLTNMSKVYGPAYDATGNSCLKLGTSKVVGTFTFVVSENVTGVVINVAKYKANTTKISVNGTEYTLTNNSNDGAYDEIVVDTSENKTVTLTTVSGGVRCMIDSIAFVGTAA